MKRSEAYDMIADRLNYFEPKETHTIEKLVSFDQSRGKPMSKSITLSEVVSTEPAGYAGNIAFELMRSGTAIACKLHRTPDKLGDSVALYTHPHEWRSIETAPKDGTPILAADKGMYAYVAEWIQANRVWIGSDGMYWEPTHWMPLPEPPKQ